MTPLRLRLALAAAVGAVYATALRAGFQFDDFRVIVDQPAVHGLRAWAAGHTGLRPLLTLSYALNGALDPGPFGFHLVNVLLHLGNTLLIFELARRLLPQAPAPEAAAALAALLFGLHPVQTEAVTYVCGRSVSLMATAYLGGLLLYVEARLRGPSPGRFAAATALFLLAGLVRETALTFPLALLLLEALPLRARGVPPPRAAELGPPLLAAGALGAYLLLQPAYHRFFEGAFRAPRPGPPGAASLEALAYLGARTLWPHPLNLDPGLLPPTAFTGRHGLVAAGLLLGGLALFRRARRHPGAAFAGGWILLHLLPTTTFVPRPELANERHLYLALAGVGFLLAPAALAAARRPGGRLLLALPLLALAVLTLRRQEDYRTELRMWTQSLAANPRNPRAHVNLGVAQAEAGDLPGARASFEAALDLDPAYAPAAENLARLPLAPGAR